MRVSIIISTWRGVADIDRLAPAIAALDTAGLDVETIVRDDASPDATADHVATRYPWVRLLRGERNLGFGPSNNAAVREATGDVLCFLNQDTVPRPEFLREGVAALTADDGVGAVNTNMIMPWVMPLDDFMASEAAALPRREYRLTRYGYVEYVEGPPRPRGANFLSGGGFLMRRACVAGDAPVFDPDIPPYCEDTDLSLRLVEAGWRLAWAPGAALYHNQPPKRLGAAGGFGRLTRITRNRFDVMARHHAPAAFAARYPLYLWGIVGKMNTLGLPRRELAPAWIAGAALAGAWALAFPWWLWRSGACARRESPAAISPPAAAPGAARAASPSSRA